MSIKNALLNTMLHELTICQHLHTKLKAEDANWRPSENMRTTVELMGYLSYIGQSTVAHFVENPEDRSLYLPKAYALTEQVKETVTFTNFSEALEEEKESIKKSFENWTDEDVLTKMTYYPWSGQDCSLFSGLNTTLQFLTAYRHQLFLYAKMRGATIGTRNNWGGVDAPAAVKEAVEEVEA